MTSRRRGVKLYKDSMIRTFILSLTLLTITKGYCQSNFKGKETFSFNLLVGYQSFFNPDDLNSKLTNNNFTKVRIPNLSLGGEFAVVGGKEVLKFQFRGTGLFAKESVQDATLQSMTISLLYGRDVLKSQDKTFLYPFVGFRMFDHTLLGQSTDGKKLNAWKVNFDFLAGVGLKQFLNADLKGIFNNIDINAGASLPAINGKWKKDGSEYVTGAYKLKPTYYLVFTIGRGFRPAVI